MSTGGAQPSADDDGEAGEPTETVAPTETEAPTGTEPDTRDPGTRTGTGIRRPAAHRRAHREASASNDPPAPEVEATEVTVDADTQRTAATAADESEAVSSFAAQTMSTPAAAAVTTTVTTPTVPYVAAVADGLRPDHLGQLRGGHRFGRRHRVLEPVHRRPARAARRSLAVGASCLGAPRVLQLLADHHLQPHAEHPKPEPRRRRGDQGQHRCGRSRRRPADVHRHRPATQRRDGVGRRGRQLHLPADERDGRGRRHGHVRRCRQRGGRRRACPRPAGAAAVRAHSRQLPQSRRRSSGGAGDHRQRDTGCGR